MLLRHQLLLRIDNALARSASIDAMGVRKPPSSVRRNQRAPALSKAAAQLEVRVGVTNAAGKVVVANPARLSALGWTPASLETLAVQNAEHTDDFGIATRYAGDWASRTKGAVQGDGRALALGVIERRSPGGRLVEVTTLQQKGGIDTGLAPYGLVKGVDHHTGGTHPLAYGISDAFFAWHLETNGHNAERWLGTTADGDLFARVFRETEQPRLAHLVELRDDPRALRQVLDDVNKELCVELGRNRLLSYDGLFKNLVTRKAKALADLFWLRMSHRSPTLDNIGLRKTIDVSTMSGEQRMSTTTRTHVEVGFAKEAHEVLSDFTEYLRVLMRKSATEPERAVLNKLSHHTIAEGAFNRAMAEKTLEHLGLDKDLAARVLHDEPRAARRLFEAVMRIGLERVGDDVPLFEPFAALAAAFKASASRQGPVAIERALAPVTEDPRTSAAATEMLELVTPLVTAALKGVTGPAREALIRVVEDQALRLNAPYETLANHEVLEWAAQLGQRAQRGEVAVVQNQLQRRVWESQRQGPTSAHDLALALRHGELEPAADGWLTVHAEMQGRVRFEERSNGATDVLRIVLDREGEPHDYQLNLDLGRTAWLLQVAPTRATKYHLEWDVPLSISERPSRYQFGFVSQGGRGPSYDSPEPGQLSGVGYQPRLGSELLQAELARWARARGLERDVVAAKAVAGLPTTPAPQRSTPRVLARVHTVEELTELELRR
jgi:hypothetical protein